MKNVNVDADGDEIMSSDGTDEFASGEDNRLTLSEETLKQIELRKGKTRIINTQIFCTNRALLGVRC